MTTANLRAEGRDPSLPRGMFLGLAVSCSLAVMAFILLPLYEMVTQPELSGLAEAARDPEVRSSIALSLGTSFGAAALCCVFGTPLAYLLARWEFPGKRILEGVIDLPIMIPHPVVGIAMLSLAGRGNWMGDLMHQVGLRLMGSVTGIVAVLVFVGMPFYVNSAKAGFEDVPRRLENVSRSLGAGAWRTFARITIPLSWRHLLAGFIMCAARAVSEFGAVVIVAYHPKVAPVLMYERFTAYGLAWSQPVAVWLIALCLALFIALRMVAGRTGRAA